MSDDFGELWSRLTAVAEQQAVPAAVGPRWCSVSGPFREWCTNLLANVHEHPSRQRVRTAKVELTDRYFEYRLSVDGRHRDAEDHPCLSRVWREAYRALHEMQLALAPEVLLDAPATIRQVRPLPEPADDERPAPPQQIAGILIGEEPEG